MLSLYFLEFSEGLGTFVIRLSQISSLFSISSGFHIVKLLRN